MAQDVVSRGDVEEELRNAESQQQRLPGKFPLRAIAKPEGNFLVTAAVEMMR
jgi:hypothetical protein